MEGRVGKKKNIFLVWLVWPLITLGIYFFVWYYKVNREARDFDPEIDVAPAVSLLAVLIGWIIIIPPFVSIYRTGERREHAAPFAGGGQVRLDDGEVGQAGQGAPASAGGPHLHLDGADVPFCLI